MALADNALVSLADTKTYMGITSSTDDALLERLINAESTRIENYCDRNFREQTYREAYNGSGQRRLRLRNFPVSAVTRVAIGNKLAFTVTSDTATDLRAVVEVQDDRLELTRHDSSGTKTHTHFEFTANGNETAAGLVSRINSFDGFNATLGTDCLSEDLFRMGGVNVMLNSAQIYFPDRDDIPYRIHDDRATLEFVDSADMIFLWPSHRRRLADAAYVRRHPRGLQSRIRRPRRDPSRFGPSLYQAGAVRIQRPQAKQHARQRVDWIVLLQPIARPDRGQRRSGCTLGPVCGSEVVSVETLIDTHGISLDRERPIVFVDATGFPTRSLQTSAGFAVGFVQPQSASEPVQYGREEMVITHKVYLKPGVDLQADDILVFDSKRLRVVGILDPGTFAYSGYHMGHVIADCVEDESDDTA